MTRRAISLMRSMLRVSRGWRGEGGDAEAAFIVTETRRVFRERRAIGRGKRGARRRCWRRANRRARSPRLALRHRVHRHAQAAAGRAAVNAAVSTAHFAATEKTDWAAHVGAHGV